MAIFLSHRTLSTLPAPPADPSSIIPGGQPGAAALAYLATDLNANEYTWNVNVVGGTHLTIMIRDKNGEIAYSAPITVSSYMPPAPQANTTGPGRWQRHVPHCCPFVGCFHSPRRFVGRQSPREFVGRQPSRRFVGCRAHWLVWRLGLFGRFGLQVGPCCRVVGPRRLFCPRPGRPSRRRRRWRWCRSPLLSTLSPSHSRCNVAFFSRRWRCLHALHNTPTLPRPGVGPQLDNCSVYSQSLMSLLLFSDFCWF